jgi:hypothetical protein
MSEQTFTSEEINAHRLLFIEALESGEYEQAFGALRIGNCYCAEGVLCDVYRKYNKNVEWRAGGVISNIYYIILYDSAMYLQSSLYSMPKEIRRWIKLCIAPEYLLTLNDSLKLNFNQIATRLRKIWNLEK